jgi:hypothetical protein
MARLSDCFCAPLPISEQLIPDGMFRKAGHTTPTQGHLALRITYLMRVSNSFKMHVSYCLSAKTLPKAAGALRYNFRNHCIVGKGLCARNLPFPSCFTHFR